MHCLPELLGKINSLMHVKHESTAWHGMSAQYMQALILSAYSIPSWEMAGAPAGSARL